MATDASERSERLWVLVVPPLLWAAHFLTSYAAAAVYCAKTGGSLAPVRLTIGVLTGVALVVMLIVALRARQRGGGGGGLLVDHPADSARERHRFLGHATLLLCGLSALAVVYQALAAVLIERCA